MYIKTQRHSVKKHYVSAYLLLKKNLTSFQYP